MKKILLIALVIVVIAAGAVYLYVFHKPARTAASEDAKFKVTSQELVAAFEKDEPAANTRYLNQVVEVRGTIAEIAESPNEISVSLKEADAMSGVTCSFDKASFDKIKFEKGKQVNIKGICSGYLMDVVLNKCDLVDVVSE